MTVSISNVALTNTFDFWRGQTNLLADALSVRAITAASNSTAGNAAVRGTFQASILVANSIGGSATVFSNDSINTTSANLTVTSGFIVANTAWFQGGTITIGNTTVNTAISNTSITTSGTLTAGALTVAGAVANATTISGTTSLSIGNSTVNVSINTTAFFVGNSSVSANVTPTSIAVGGTVTATQNIVSNSTVQALTVRLANSTVNTAFTVPNTSQITAGTWFLNADGTWKQVSSPTSVGGANTHVQFNDSGNPGGNAAFTFDKTTFNVVLSNTFSAAGAAFLQTSNTVVANVNINNSSTSGIANAEVVTKVGANNTSYLKVTTNYNSGSPQGLLEFGNTIANATIITTGSTPLNLITNNTISQTIYSNNTVNFLKSPTIGGSQTVVDTGYFANSTQYLANNTNRVLTAEVIWASVVPLNQGNTSTSSIALDLANSVNFTLLANGNFTLANPSNLKPGQSGFIQITQDGTGSRTIAYGTSWKFPAGTSKALSTTASSVDTLFYTVANTTYIYSSLNKAFA